MNSFGHKQESVLAFYAEAKKAKKGKKEKKGEEVTQSSINTTFIWLYRTFFGQFFVEIKSLYYFCDDEFNEKVYNW